MVTKAMIRREIQKQAVSEAGRALAALGFTPTHNGGGIVNFTRPVDGGGFEYVMTGLNLDGWGPLTLVEPAVLMDPDMNETAYPSLEAFIRTRGL